VAAAPVTSEVQTTGGVSRWVPVILGGELPLWEGKGAGTIEEEYGVWVHIEEVVVRGKRPGTLRHLPMVVVNHTVAAVEEEIVDRVVVEEEIVDVVAVEEEIVDRVVVEEEMVGVVAGGVNR